MKGLGFEVFETQSGQKWILEELRIARRCNISIIGATSKRHIEIEGDVRELCRVCVDADLDKLAQATDALRQ
jgi:hypothetical protein